jgi:hypothetical protein
MSRIKKTATVLLATDPYVTPVSAQIALYKAAGAVALPDKAMGVRITSVRKSLTLAAAGADG